MSFKGLENVGSAFSKYGDLVAQGMKDQIDLQNQMQQRKLQNSIEVQKAAKEYGLYANDPETFAAYGGSELPITQYGSQGAAAPSTAAPQPSGGPAPASLPMTGAAGTPQSVAETPPPASGSNEGQDLNITSQYQKQLQGLAPNAGGQYPMAYQQHSSAQPSQPSAMPYAAAQQSAANEKMYQQRQEYDRAALINQGKSDRATAGMAARATTTSEKIIAANHDHLIAQAARIQSSQGFQFNQSLQQQAASFLQQAKNIEEENPKLMGISPESSGGSAGPSDEKVWSDYVAKHPSVIDSPGNRKKVLAAFKKGS